MDVAGIDEETDVICWLIIPTPSWDRRVLPQRITFLSLIFPINANLVIPYLGFPTYTTSPKISQSNDRIEKECSSVQWWCVLPIHFIDGGEMPAPWLMFVEWATTVEKWLNIFNFQMKWKLVKAGGTRKLLTVATCATNPRPLYRGGDNPLDPPQPHPT